MLPLVFYVLILGGSFTLGILALWLIRKMSVKYRLVAVPNVRTSHKKIIPNIAGLSFYLAVPLTLAFTWKQHVVDPSFLLMILAVTVFLVLGLFDDIRHTRAVIKLVFQALGLALFIAGSGWLIRDFFGLVEFGGVMAFGYTLFFGLVVINAINMLDGIDGLAGILGMAVSVLMGLFCYFQGIAWGTVLSFSTAGLLLAFLRYNFSARYKMMMGDTGSLWIGFLMAIMLIYGQGEAAGLAEVSPFGVGIWKQEVWLALLAVPLFDFFRVFFLRLVRGQSPFRADRRHIHHLFVDRYAFSHLQADILIVVINLGFFLVALLFSPYFGGWQYLLTYLVFFLVYCAGLYYLSLHRQKKPRAEQSPSLKHS